jgi:hypothetical protein
MKIQFERTGGFAGMHMSTTIDTKTLPPNDAKDVQDLIDSSQFFQVPPNSASLETSKASKGAADYFTYKITVENGEKKHSVECNDLNMQPKVKRLVNFLTKHSKK